MTTFVALYRGETVASAKLVAVTADPSLVADVSSRLLQSLPTGAQDRVIGPIDRGRRAALRQIHQEAESDRRG